MNRTLRRVWHVWIIGAVGLLLGSAALAQNPGRIDEIPPPSDSCMTRPTQALAYPPVALAWERAGLFRMALTFRGATTPPDVEMLTQFGSIELRQAALARVAEYRMPCMQEGAAPVTVEQAIQFTARPMAESHARRPQEHEPRSARLQELHRCLRTPQEQLNLRSPFYGRDTANVYLSFGFTDPQAPPTIKVLYNSANDRLFEAIKAYVAAFRLPCITDKDEPFWLEQGFRYQGTQPEQRMATTVGLRDFLSNVKGIRQMIVLFDFDAMGCPFEVDWGLNLPAFPNGASQVGSADEYDPRREPFLQWLDTLELQLSPQRYESLLGSRTRIQVPCGRLNLAAD